MKRQYTLLAFHELTYGSKCITATGRYELGGNLEINTSSILTRLIQEAGRWCERFASDLFIYWQSIVAKMESLDDDNREETILLGFRKDGVDSTQSVLYQYNENGRTYADGHYRKLYRLDMSYSDNSVLLRLYEVEAR